MEQTILNTLEKFQKQNTSKSRTKPGQEIFLPKAAAFSGLFDHCAIVN